MHVWDHTLAQSRFDEAAEDMRARASMEGSDETLSVSGLSYDAMYLLIE